MDFKADTPTIIIFFTDDQDYQDVGCFGSSLIKISNFDKMARQGMRFTISILHLQCVHYQGMALLTGCYPPKVGVPLVI